MGDDPQSGLGRQLSELAAGPRLGGRRRPAVLRTGAGRPRDVREPCGLVRLARGGSARGRQIRAQEVLARIRAVDGRRVRPVVRARAAPRAALGRRISRPGRGRCRGQQAVDAGRRRERGRATASEGSASAAALRRVRRGISSARPADPERIGSRRDSPRHGRAVRGAAGRRPNRRRVGAQAEGQEAGGPGGCACAAEPKPAAIRRSAGGTRGGDPRP